MEKTNIKKKIIIKKILLGCVPLVVFVLFSLLTQNTARAAWSQANFDGFGDPNNKSITSMAVFSGDLYAGTRNLSTGTEIWRTSDGTSWGQVNTDGFGDSGNVSVISLAVFSGYLYAGTYNTSGAEVWRSSDGTSWDYVVGSGPPSRGGGNGFGDTNNYGFYSMDVFGSYLYVGSRNTISGGEIWRSSDGTTWNQANSDGFGDGYNLGVYSLSDFGSYLYAGTENVSDGGEVWRSSDGTSWDYVVGDGPPQRGGGNGFGDTGNTKAASMEIFGGLFYIGTENPTTGTEVWRSSNGTDWSQVNADGFGDANNSVFTMKSLGSYLYAGTDNSSTGTEIWRTASGTSWTQNNVDGFGDSNNETTFIMSVNNSYLYAGTNNPSTGAEIWRQYEEGPEEDAIPEFSLFTLGIAGFLGFGAYLILRRYKTNYLCP